MKNIVFLILVFSLLACTKRIKESNNDSAKSLYDSTKAMEYGADEYGMKKYVMTFLKRGPNRDQDSATAVDLQNAHLKNIIRMAEEGKLVLAGPFLDSGDVRGIYIFNVETIDEAKELTGTDPAIKAGRLEMKLRPWYGSAALMEVTEISKSLAKNSITANDK